MQTVQMCLVAFSVTAYLDILEMASLVKVGYNYCGFQKLLSSIIGVPYSYVMSSMAFKYST